MGQPKSLQWETCRESKVINCIFILSYRLLRAWITMTLTLADIIFSEASTGYKDHLVELKRSRSTVINHLYSIEQDSQFICSVADTLGLPLIANERCGSWYVRTDRRAGSAYFKSTDGHFGHWSFSTRRLNLHILDIIGANNGYGGSRSFLPTFCRLF